MQGTLTDFQRAQLRIARDTLKLHDWASRVMGGPTKEEARNMIEKLTGRRPKETPCARGCCHA